MMYGRGFSIRLWEIQFVLSNVTEFAGVCPRLGGVLRLTSAAVWNSRVPLCSGRRSWSLLPFCCDVSSLSKCYWTSFFPFVHFRGGAAWKNHCAEKQEGPPVTVGDLWPPRQEADLQPAVTVNSICTQALVGRISVLCNKKPLRMSLSSFVSCVSFKLSSLIE